MGHSPSRVRMSPGVGSAGFALLLALLSVTAAEAKVDLRGRVLTSEGRPLPGASVFIYTAKPRVGTSALCPSCYPDCGKMRHSGRDGRFMIPALSESLLFRVLVSAPGHEPVFADTLDPASGPIEPRLRPRDFSKVDLGRSIRGRVVDQEAKPVVGAIIKPQGFKSAGRMAFGTIGVKDPMSVTDERGEFLLAAHQEGATWFLQIEARGLASRAFHDVPTGVDDLIFQLTPGAILTGRVQRDGRPATDVVIGLRSGARAAGNLIIQDEIATDERGRFTFLNVAPGAPYLVYGKMGAVGGGGAIAAHPLTSAADDSVLDLGILVVEPGHRIAGRVSLTDGKPLPEGIRLAVGRELASDTRLIPLGAEGSFELRGVPTELIHLSAGVPGYRLSPKTVGFGGYSGVTLGVDRDFEGLEILFEPDDDGQGQPPPRSP
jgi:hypothetical protein